MSHVIRMPAKFILSTINNKLVCQWKQDQIDAAVKHLLALKAEFKQLTGQDYKPGMAPPISAPSATTSSLSFSSPSVLYERVAQQGEAVRKLKSQKSPKVFWYNILWLICAPFTYKK